MTRAITHKDEQKRRLLYIIGDLTASIVSWVIYFFFKANVLQIATLSLNTKFWVTLTAYCCGWMFLHYLSGYYNRPIPKSRVSELFTTTITTFIGCVILFFTLVSNDEVEMEDVNISIIALFSIQFTLTYIIRLIQTQKINDKIHRREIGLNTVIIGDKKQAELLKARWEKERYSSGYRICHEKLMPWDSIGINPLFAETEKGQECLPDAIIDFIRKENIKYIVVALDKETKDKGNALENLGCRRELIKIATTTDCKVCCQAGNEGMDSLQPLFFSDMNDWETNTKKAIDIFLACIALIVLSPLLIATAITVALTSPGGAIYRQTRLGLHGKPFTLYKFRSMYISENPDNSLTLTHTNDPRITKFGLLLRRYHIDELPQLINIIKGEMSIVGPRPEQPYYAERLEEMSPEYALRYILKPGLTSWGMVKYGYADTEDKMLQRSKYELRYLQKRSLTADIKIVLYTIRTIATGNGM